MVFMSKMKERRFVLGGGLSGVALNVTLSVALPPPGGGGFVDLPLQEIKETADSKSSKAKTFRKFTRPPRQSLCRAYGEQALTSRMRFYRLPANYGCKRNVDCSTAKYESR